MGCEHRLDDGMLPVAMDFLRFLYRRAIADIVVFVAGVFDIRIPVVVFDTNRHKGREKEHYSADQFSSHRNGMRRHLCRFSEFEGPRRAKALVDCSFRGHVPASCHRRRMALVPTVSRGILRACLEQKRLPSFVHTTNIDGAADSYATTASHIQVEAFAAFVKH